MSASMLSRQRKRRRDETIRYARYWLRAKRLPRGVPALLREWEQTWTDDEIQFGLEVRELQALLKPYRKVWFGV